MELPLIPTGTQETKSAYDKEVEEMLLNEEEQAKKKELWEAANGEWLRQQEEKRKERELNGTKVTKRKKKQTVSLGRLCDVESRSVQTSCEDSCGRTETPGGDEEGQS